MTALDRRKIIAELEALRGTRVISYVTSTRPGLEASMAMDVIPVVFEHLRLCKADPKPNIPRTSFRRRDRRSITRVCSFVDTLRFSTTRTLRASSPAFLATGSIRSGDPYSTRVIRCRMTTCWIPRQAGTNRPRVPGSAALVVDAEMLPQLAG